MAKAPAKKSNQSRLKAVSTGPKLVGFGVALFVLTRVIVFLPLGLVGSWINGFLYPVMLLSILAGGALMYRKSKK